MEGYINYNTRKKEWSAHKEYHGKQYDPAVTFKCKDDVIEYVKNNQNVRWYWPYDIGQMSY